MDGSAETKRLGLLDQAGVDTFILDAGDDSLRTVIQCKGFEVFDYGIDQHRQCRDEVAKFLAKGPRAVHYWLVINRSIKDRAQRKELEGDLAGLVANGKVTKAELLDLEATVKRLTELAIARLFSWSEIKRRELFEFYGSRMHFVRHIGSVPFNETMSDPTSFVLERFDSFFKGLAEHQTGKYRNAPKFLITSEFGFGKTTTLHAVSQRWIDSGRHLIYAPAALLGHQAFVNASGLADGLLHLIIPDDADLSALAMQEFRNALRSILTRSKDWLLLIDGLDENSDAFRANSLAALWGSIADLGIPALLSARDELVELREAEFTYNPILRIGPTFDRIKLNDWDDRLIAEFVSLYAAAARAETAMTGPQTSQDDPAGFREFRSLIATSRYNEVYGDIPKRPLFLGMLVEDAWKGHEPARYLHRLYGTYFRSKFDLDRSSMAARGIQRRPSAIVDALGDMQTREILIRVMQGAADQMLEITGPPNARSATHRDTIGERKLREIAAGLGIPFAQVEDVAMHSLLQPSGRDPVTRERLLRFAHRSFQDWFVARQFAETGRDIYMGLPRSALQFLAAMRADLAAGEPLP